MLRIMDQKKRPSSERLPEEPRNAYHGLRPSRWVSLGLVAVLIGGFGAVAAQEPTETTDPFGEYPTPSDEPASDEPSADEETVTEPTEGTTAPEQDQSTPPPSDCAKTGINAQCNSFGSISMPSQREIKGDPVDIEATITIETLFPEHNARWVLFSLRNVTEEGQSPVMIGMRSFSTQHGPLVTTRVEQKEASELNLWVETLDVPTNTPITLSVTVGVSERGAYVLELLVMAFDRGYTPIMDNSGTPQSLYSFTLLGVNKETKEVDVENNSLIDGNKVPSLPFAAGLGLLLAVAVIVRTRRSA